MNAICRYERKHQFGKTVTRFSKNFRNTAITIHSSHQKRRALFLESSEYAQLDFFSEQQESHLVVLPQCPANCRQLPASEHPFSTKKNVLRKLIGRNDLYFKVASFHQETVNKTIFCTGSVWRKKVVERNGRRVFSRPNETLFELEEAYSSETCIRLESLHFANDFIFAHGATVYLLEWIN